MDPEQISPEDIAFLKLLKKEVKSTPGKDDAESLKDWMLQYLSTSGKLEVKKEQESTKTKEYIPIPKMREPPRISTFSGSNNKGETTYALWRYEICGLMADHLYDPESINYAVRRSLKGDAGMIAMNLGPKASVVEILEKLDSIYGDVERKEDLLAQFYRARQEDDESVTKWSCRLETIIGKIVEKNIIQKKDTNEMLRSMLWTGLRSELKDISGHKYDAIKDFDQLRVALRQIEMEHLERKPRKPQPAKAASSSSEESTIDKKMEEFRGMIQNLNLRFDKMEQQQNQYRRNPNYGKNRGNYRPKQNQKWRTDDTQQNLASSTPDTGRKIVCYRCGQEGHKRIGCANPPKQYQGLNSRKPMEQDRH